MRGKWILCALLCLTLCLGLCACSQEELEPVSVQSVGLITGIGSVGLMDRFAGMVEAGESVQVEKDEQLKVKELLVSAGDRVTEGQILFTYDVELMSLDLDKLRLELEQMKAAMDTKTHQIEDLEKEKAKAGKDDQLSYTLQIQELQIDLTETGLNITAKEKEIARMETLLEKDRVLSPVSGRVQKINENGGYDDYGNPLPFLSIQQTETYRVKGNINEQNAAALSPGMPVTIRSRVDDSYWTGVVDYIDWENPVKSENNYYYDMSMGGEMSQTSKYPFYVVLDDDEGLKLGQHVFIEPGWPAEAEERLMLPAWCICDAGTDAPWVWAVDAKETLEKRPLTLGEYDPDTDCYEVLEGISLQDYLAPPSETCKEGAPVVYYSESDFEVPEGPIYYEGGELGFEDGELGFEEGEFGIDDGSYIDNYIDNENNGEEGADWNAEPIDGAFVPAGGGAG